MLIAVAFALLVSAGASATPTPVFSARECPALFGDEAERRRNRAYRRRHLHWVHQEPGGTTVAHSKDDWETPIELRVSGMKLADAPPGAGAQEALVEVSAGVASTVGCSPGLYRLAVDDMIAQRTRVLAVLRGLLLLDVGGRLAFIDPPSAAPHRWLMAWRVRAAVRPKSNTIRLVPRGKATRR